MQGKEVWTLMHLKPLYNDACYTNADLMFAYDKVLEDY